MPEAFDYLQLQANVQALNPDSFNCRESIADARRSMDQACDIHAITVSEWRSLQERVSHVQAMCAYARPGAWRYPPPLPQCNTRS